MCIFAIPVWLNLLFVGCSSSQQKSQNSTPNPASTQQTQGRTLDGQSSPGQNTGTTHDTRPVIVTFGDSLTAGVVDNTYPQYLQDLLDQKGYKFRVENQGVSGDTTTDGLARIDNVVSAHPALVILEFGGNDGLRGLPVKTTEENLSLMIERLETAKIPTVLLGITLPPNYGPDYLKGFNAIFPALAKKYHLRLFPFLLLHVYQHADMMQPDGIHPNGQGNRVVARDVFELIQPVLPTDGKKTL